MTTAYPLQWPPQQKRTPKSERRYGRFGTREGYSTRSITLAGACRRVREELDKYTQPGRNYRVDMDSIIVSTMLRVRKTDGMPKSGQRMPEDPGAAVYFELDGRPRVIASDAFTRLEDNIAAIAGVIEALRKIERYGSQMAEAAYTGFDALPSPDFVVTRSWRDVLDYYGSSIREAKSAYMRARKIAHPDHGGSDSKFEEVNRAWKQAQSEIGDK